ncbi:YggT family protein [Candidatus Aerophobetes bacterium]|uniref:YggT family protein n=1 Tax=Aerophobetes bacterium TaxID=2030807 RepID=A0A2A4YEK9_UNCAE|nr:MAG: YggT family protein [Candidatus Aerophobetes bacterium]
MLASFVKVLFTTYTLILLAKVIGSWFPQGRDHSIMRFLNFLTDPYLNIFRKIIPPIGGMIDLSPLIGFLVLQFAETIILRYI